MVGHWYWLVKRVTVCKGSLVVRLADWSLGYISSFVYGGARAGLTTRSICQPPGTLREEMTVLSSNCKGMSQTLSGDSIAVGVVQVGGMGGLCCLGLGPGPSGHGSFPLWYLKLACDWVPSVKGKVRRAWQ